MRVAVITRYFPTSHEPWAGHSAYQTLRFLAKRCELKVFYPESHYPPLLTPKSRAGRQIDLKHRPAGVDVVGWIHRTRSEQPPGMTNPGVESDSTGTQILTCSALGAGRSVDLRVATHNRSRIEQRSVTIS